MNKKHILYYYIIALGFTLGIYRGNLALWKDGHASPVSIFPLSVDALPEADRKLLESGIRAENISELTACLEDYLS